MLEKNVPKIIWMAAFLLGGPALLLAMEQEEAAKKHFVVIIPLPGGGAAIVMTEEAKGFLKKAYDQFSPIATAVAGKGLGVKPYLDAAMNNIEKAITGISMT